MTAINNHRAFRIVEVPSVSYLLDVQHDHYAFNKSWAEAQSEPLFVVHTSGSTGLPKPLLYTHATAATNVSMMSLNPPAGYQSQDRVYQAKRVFITFPPFHVGSDYLVSTSCLLANCDQGAYLVSHLFNAIPFGTVMIAPTSGAIPSGEGLVEGLKKAPADVAFLVPSIVQDLAQSPHLLECCSKNLEAIIYCGGDLPQAIGDTVASKITLLNQFGASELGLTPQILSTENRGPEDWKYAQFHPELGLELRPVSDSIHELYAVRDLSKKGVQPTFTIFPDIEEYASRDLFVRHPSKTKEDLWSWQARADDIIVFLNGEKTNPISMEQYIVAHNKDISAALVVGAQRFQAALLIEPTTDGKELGVTERAAFIERIWPTIEDAIKDAPSHARLMKSHVLFTQPQKPMVRAGKGTISRAATLRSYASEIDALYKDVDALFTDLKGGSDNQSQSLNEETVRKCVKESVLSTVRWSSLDESANFFALGMDSLQAMAIVRKLRESLATSTIALSTVYTNPSLSALTNAILCLLEEHQSSQASQDQMRVKCRHDIIDEYKLSIDSRLLPGPNTSSESRQEVVILTGSTGTLGSYLLDALLDDPRVAHIYCLNRGNDSQLRQLEKNRRLGIQTRSNNTRVSFIMADLSEESLKLSKGQYDDLVSQATLVIHNAWLVNFNLSLSSFRPQLDGLVNLLALVGTTEKSARLFYTSSISSMMAYRSETRKTPEKPVIADSAPASNGYAESKYTAEQIIEYTAQKLSSSGALAFARVGQLAGAVNHSGIWNKDEWFPSMIISSVHIGALPESLGPVFDEVDWVPIDLAAGILIDLALNRHQSQAMSANSGMHHADVYHLINPHTTSWTALQSVVLEELSSLTRTRIEVIPLRMWIAKVRKEAESMVGNGDNTGDIDLETALQTNPAAKLLDFYEGLLSSEAASINKLEVSGTIKLSQGLREMPSVKDDWMRKWIREWFGPPANGTKEWPQR